MAKAKKTLAASKSPAKKAAAKKCVFCLALHCNAFRYRRRLMLAQRSATNLTQRALYRLLKKGAALVSKAKRTKKKSSKLKRKANKAKKKAKAAEKETSAGCVDCEKKVLAAISALPESSSVHDVKASHETGKLTMCCDGDKEAVIAAMKKAVEASGFHYEGEGHACAHGDGHDHSH